ncbi:MAG: adenine deaminase, partial [Thaumarchaeota archaeon]|nr:adenine deaminase [Nitrososphaerota archaeon]
MSSLAELNRSLINVAMGREQADVVIRNGLIVNVLTGEIIKGDVAVKNRRIAFVGDASHTVGSST